MFRSLRRRLFRLVLVSGAGAAANYFLDRERGQDRREQAKAKADSLLKGSAPSATWQPGGTAANVFDTPPAPASPVVTPPAMTDVIVTPEREIDPLATRP